MSAPLAFKTTLETIPASVPYLAAPSDRTTLWRRRLGTKRKTRIGLAWSGSPGTVNDVQRSVPLKLLLPIIGENAEWYSLQKHVRERDRDALSATLAIINHAETFTDFSDTAAIIAELDLVISVDCVISHLAGAMGKPVWILLAYHADFRYLRDRENNPWYPTARLFRQRTEGDWASVFDRLQPELNEFWAKPKSWIWGSVSPGVTTLEGKIIRVRHDPSFQRHVFSYLVRDAAALAIGNGFFPTVEAQAQLLAHVPGRGPAHQWLDLPRGFRFKIEHPSLGIGKA